MGSRKPLEDFFLTELDFVRGRYPQHEIFTLGSSLVSGEKFIPYLTFCFFLAVRLFQYGSISYTSKVNIKTALSSGRRTPVNCRSGRDADEKSA